MAQRAPGRATETTTRAETRTSAIADAAVGVIARDGLRALTHRAVDRAAGLPQGSTSYYAPTRRALLEVVVRRLAERSAHDTSRAVDRLGALTPAASAPDRVAQLADAATALVDALAARRDDMRARYALLLELDGDDDLHATLSTRSPVRGDASAAVTALLGRFGVTGPADRAAELMQLADALTFTRVAGLDAAASTPAVLEGYLRGVVPRDGGRE